MFNVWQFYIIHDGHGDTFFICSESLSTPPFDVQNSSVLVVEVRNLVMGPMPLEENSFWKLCSLIAAFMDLVS